MVRISAFSGSELEGHIQRGQVLEARIMKPLLCIKVKSHEELLQSLVKGVKQLSFATRKRITEDARKDEKKDGQEIYLRYNDLALIIQGLI